MSTAMTDEEMNTAVSMADELNQALRGASLTIRMYILDRVMSGYCKQCGDEIEDGRCYCQYDD